MGRDHTGTFAEKIKRQVYLDKLRVLATVLVIAVHTVSVPRLFRSGVRCGMDLRSAITCFCAAICFLS